MENHAGVTGWQLVGRVVFLIKGADRFFRRREDGGFQKSVVYRLLGVSKLYPSPPPKKELFFSYRGPIVYYVPGGTGGFRKCGV